MKKSSLFLLFSLFSSLLHSSEPSAFAAGDLSLANPYGLTQSEKELLQTKKSLRKVEIKSNTQANRVDSLRERLDGLQSIVETIGVKAHKNRVNLKRLSEKTDKSFLNTQEYEKRLSLAIEQNSKIVQENLQNIEKLKVVIKELSLVVDSINAKYVTQDDFNALVKDLNSFKKSLAKELAKVKAPAAKSTDSCSSMPNGKVADKAAYYFKRKYYTKAIKCYKYLIKKKYKPAKSHYMIGEMMFRRGEYGEAIAYFKKSAALYSKASYMPTLMLHTAIAMKRTHDTENANVFFNAIISKYPNSKEAQEAKKYL